MNASNSTDLISSLQQRGVRMWARQGRLHVQAPPGTLLAQDLSALRDQKAAIMQSLELDELAGEITCEPRARASLVPLTPLQLDKWRYVSEQCAGLSQRTCVVAQSLTGPLDVELLKASLDGLVQRHESLRSRLVVSGDTPGQQVEPAWTGEVSLIDLQARTPTESERLIAERSGRFIAQKIDLRVGPVFAAELFRVSSREHVLVMAVDHMFADAFSCDILGRELWVLYEDAARGLPSRLAELSLQFLDYVLWQHRTRAAWMRAHAEYWQGQLSDAPRIQFPRDEGATQPASPCSDFVTVSFGAPLSAALNAVARHERTLLALVVLAVYVAALTRWLRQRDFTLAVVSAARDRSELEGMIGFLSDYLHLRVQATEDDAFLDLLARLSQEFRRMYEHQDYGRAPAIAPECVTELAFNWIVNSVAQAGSAAASDLPATMTIRPYSLPLPPLPPLPPPFKFAAQFRETDTGIVAIIVYQPELFSRSAVESFGFMLRRLADDLTHNPTEPIRSIGR